MFVELIANRMTRIWSEDENGPSQHTGQGISLHTSISASSYTTVHLFIYVPSGTVDDETDGTNTALAYAHSARMCAPRMYECVSACVFVRVRFLPAARGRNKIIMSLCLYGCTSG